MFAGHFGIAAAAKAVEPKVPTWSLIVAAQLLDILFLPLNAAGVETMDFSIGNGYGEAIIHADFTHSLTGALAISVAAGFAAWRAWGRRAGAVISSVVFSHWLLDLLVHRSDLAILPGNAYGLPLLGFGLWRFPAYSIALECVLLIIGFLTYLRFVAKNSTNRTKSILSGTAMGLFLAASLIIGI